MSQGELARGVWGVMATPFQGSALDVCEASIERLVHLYSDAGAVGLTVLGVFGEAQHLTMAEQRDVIEFVTAANEARLPLVVGTYGQATQTVIEQIDNVRLADPDLDTFMVQISTSDPNRLLRHLTAIHDATGVRIVLQDYPLVTGVHIDQRVLAKVVDTLGPMIAAIKSEAPPTPVAIAALCSTVRVPVFGGLGGVGLIDELAAGAAGAMTGFSFPEGLVAACRAFQDAGVDAAREAFSPWLPLANFESQDGIALSIRKEILRTRGQLLEAGVRLPAKPFPNSLQDSLSAHVHAAEKALAGAGSGQ